MRQRKRSKRIPIHSIGIRSRRASRGYGMQAKDPTRRLRFGIFEVDLQTGELTKQGKRLKLQEQPFQLLAMLLERPGELVTRLELSTRLWPQTNVDFDHGLNKAVGKIREALGDSSENPRFIETVARRGYRFLADVAVVSGNAPETVAEHPAPQGSSGPIGVADAGGLSRRTTVAWKSLGLGMALVLVVSVSLIFYPRLHAPLAARALAVLPLENLSGDPSQDYLAEG